MKKILLIVCMAFACQLVFAQDEDDDDKKKEEDMYGFSLGLNYANIVGKDEKNDALWGGQAGLYFSFWQAQRLRLCTYLLYDMIGAKFSNDSRYKLNYIVLPVMLNYMVAQQLYLGLGLQPGVLLSAKYKYNGQSIDAKDNLKTFELAVPIDVEYYFWKGFSMGLRYTRGITKINDTGNSNAYNSVGSLIATYRF